jgi:hypothetical protein
MASTKQVLRRAQDDNSRVTDRRRDFRRPQPVTSGPDRGHASVR